MPQRFCLLSFPVILNKRRMLPRFIFQRVTSDVSAWFCDATGLDVTAANLIFGTPVMPDNPKGWFDARAPSVMSCLSELDSQIATLLVVPHEILLLRHRVFREYAKIAVGTEFVHTLPSFLIVMAAVLVFWKYPPSATRLLDLVGATLVYKSFQVKELLFTFAVFTYFNASWPRAVILQGVDQLAYD